MLSVKEIEDLAWELLCIEDEHLRIMCSESLTRSKLSLHKEYLVMEKCRLEKFYNKSIDNISKEIEKLEKEDSNIPDNNVIYLEDFRKEINYG